MLNKLFKLLKVGLTICSVVVATLLAIRIYDTQRGPALEPWHRYIPKEMSARELDKADWDQYIQAEKAIFEEIR